MSKEEMCNSDDDEAPLKTTIKTATDLQRLKIEKLMSNPEKLAYIPDQSKDKKFPDAPEFVRNVMGSSAGAGSGEFHVYRHIRRREYSRQEFMVKNKEKEILDQEYIDKLEANKREAEEKTAKKRAKRQKQKERMRNKKKNKGEVKPEVKDFDDSEDNSNSEDEER